MSSMMHLSVHEFFFIFEHEHVKLNHINLFSCQRMNILTYEQTNILTYQQNKKGQNSLKQKPTYQHVRTLTCQNVNHQSSIDAAY